MTDPSNDRHDVRTFVRNRWFTGKLLDAYHMQLESDSVMHKRWLLNRLVLGSGVALGLDVHQATPYDPLSYVVTAGLAIDWWGREIIVPQTTKPYKIDDDTWQKAIDHLRKQQQTKPPPKHSGAASRGGKGSEEDEGEEPEDEVRIQLRICYRETLGDPVPAEFGNECPGATCVPGSIYEGYEVHFAPLPAERPHRRCEVPDLPGAVFPDYHRLLALWVTRHRPRYELVAHKDPSLALANLCIEVDGDGNPIGKPEIDIAVREIVYYNDLLFQLILGLAEEPDQRE
jgi:hypothetical protein